MAFSGLIAACFVLGRYFAERQMRGWAWYSRISGLLFLAGFVGVTSGSNAAPIVLGFSASVVIVWAWIAALSVHLYRHLPQQSGA